MAECEGVTIVTGAREFKFPGDAKCGVHTTGAMIVQYANGDPAAVFPPTGWTRVLYHYAEKSKILVGDA